MISKIDIDNFKPFSFETIIENEIFDRLSQFCKIVLTPIELIGYNKKKVCRATGMSYTELNKFLASHKFNTTSKYIEYKAMEALEKWYLKKLKRFVKNGLSTEEGIKDKLLFLEFCKKYKKQGHRTINSWKDIDEERILEDFRNECSGTLPVEPFHNNEYSLFSEIYSSILFHIRLHIIHHYSLSSIIISFIISNRYHIFTTDADSDADKTMEINIIKYNLPRSVVPYGLAS